MSKKHPKDVLKGLLKKQPPKRKLTEPEKEARRLANVAKREAFFAKLNLVNLPLPEFEYLFTREIGLKTNHRSDYAWPKFKIALEVEGGIWSNGGHVRGSGKTRDIAKMNLYALAGYRVIYCVPKTLCSKETIQLINDLLK